MNSYWFLIAVSKTHTDSSSGLTQSFVVYEWSPNVNITSAGGGTSFQQSLPRGQWITLKFVKGDTNFTIHVDGVQKTQLPSSYVTFGSVHGDEGIRLGGNTGPSTIVASYRNFKIYNYVV